MRVVTATQRDVDRVWSLIGRCKFALEVDGILQWDDAYPSRTTVETDVRRGALYLLENDDGRCVASITLDETQADEYASLAWTSPEPALVVHRLCVDPDAQGRGHAHRLMDFAEAYATRSGYASVRLDAYTGNPRSVGLYRRRGYREVGQIRFPRRSLPFGCFELIVRPAGASPP